MSNQVYMFTLNGCSHCTELKKGLKEQNIDYVELEIGKNREIWEQVVKQTGHNVLPTVFISMNGGEDGPVFVPGRDYIEKDEVISKIKEYL